ncbi:hypothetical protein [Streptomyces sp. NPDC090445]|uniref:hypothetical protein n=1 Tax=Streptomyces sp. NPDC090445 TaxID=3365963 RepID=UPI00382911DA
MARELGLNRRTVSKYATDWTGGRPVIVGHTLLFSVGSVLCAAAQGVEDFRSAWPAVRQ